MMPRARLYVGHSTKTTSPGSVSIVIAWPRACELPPLTSTSPAASGRPSLAAVRAAIAARSASGPALEP